MTIWDLCIKRPIFTAMLVSAPIVLGLMARARLGVNLLPNVEVPVVVVSTTLRGAGVEEMETSVTKPLEEIINTVNGIDEIHGTTKEGISQIVVQFVLEKSRDVAAQEVRDKISTVLSTLPIGTDQPVIDKIDLSAMPVLSIAVSSDRPMQEITEIAQEDQGRPGELERRGRRDPGRRAAARGECDCRHRQAHRLQPFHRRRPPGPHPAKPRNARRARGPGCPRVGAPHDGARAENGRFPRLDRRQPERLPGADPRSRPSGRHLRGASGAGPPQRDSGSGRGASRRQQNAVSLIVQKQSGDNTVTVVERVKRRLDEIRQVLPPDIETFVVKDQSIFIVRSIEELNFHLVVAALLVAATILVFIQDWRTTIIAGLSIPASIIATFAFMYWMGYTLNNMTMLGLILAIGIVIDDAVVIHENIFRHMEENGFRP